MALRFDRAGAAIARWLDAGGGGAWQRRCIVTIDEATDAACRRFGADVERSTRSKRASRGESTADVERAIEQAALGKAGEWATWRLLRERWSTLRAPDMRILQANEKRFDVDLVGDVADGVPRVHVKTQHVAMARAFGPSWAFTCGANDVDRGVFGADRIADQRVALVLALGGRRYMLVALVALQSLHAPAFLFDPPACAALRTSKLFVYLHRVAEAQTPAEPVDVADACAPADAPECADWRIATDDPRYDGAPLRRTVCCPL